MKGFFHKLTGRWRSTSATGLDPEEEEEPVDSNQD